MPVREYDKIERYIYRCSSKRCKGVRTVDHRVHVVATENPNTYYQSFRYRKYYDGLHEWPQSPKCPECGRSMYGKPVKGTYSPDHKCDSRCIYAKGPDCECSCGGANHGSGHLG